jgi:hypothetical protein
LLDACQLFALKNDIFSKKTFHQTSEKASPAGHTPEGADGSAYYRDGTCGTGGAGAFYAVSRKLPAGSTVCRTGAGGCAGLRVPGSLYAGRVWERQQSLRTAGTYDGTGRSAGSPGLRRRPTCRPVKSAAPDTAGSLKLGIRPAPSDTEYFRPVSVPEVSNLDHYYYYLIVNYRAAHHPQNPSIIPPHCGSCANSVRHKYWLHSKMQLVINML